MTRSETMKRLRAEMNRTIEETSVVAREAKLRLENLDASNARAATRPGAARAPPNNARGSPSRAR